MDMETMRDSFSESYYPTDMAEFDFDLLQDLHNDFNLLDDDGVQNSTPLTLSLIKQECSSSSNSNSGSELSEFCNFDQYSSVDSSSSPFSVDSPPLTPPSIELEIVQTQPHQRDNVMTPHYVLQQIPSQKRLHVKIENESNSNTTTSSCGSSISNSNNALLVPEEIISKFPKILPAVPSARGRSSLSQDSPDILALKRNIRMIRNRESASLSRKKKKDYMSNLETRCKELEIENAKLKHENCTLKTRLNQLLQSETLSTAKSIASSFLTSSSSSAKKAKVLPSVTAKVALFGLCCFMFVSIRQPTNYINPSSSSNISSTSNNNNNNIHHIKGGGAVHSRPIALTHNVPELPPLFDSPGIRARRSLLWNGDDDESHHENTNNINWQRRNNDTNENITDDLLFRSNLSKEKSFDNVTLTDEPIVNCPTTFNTTEAMRVQNDLKGIFSHKPKRKAPAPKPFVYSLIDVTSNDNKELTVYDEKMRRFSRVLDQLQRRSDTFYVVSLAVESQLLLSAKSHNASARPKMSLIMPWKNDTLGGKEEIISIECEVTSVFNLNRRKRSSRRSNK